MDRATLEAYDKHAAAFAQEWHEQPPPTDLHDIVTRFFIKGGVTADIGCGSGREAAWLAANGFRPHGYDASRGLVAEARRRYPQLAFDQADLPQLASIAADSFDNVLCETVIMHLPRADIAPSVRRLLDIVKPGGVLYLSWRVTRGQDQRDGNGRLYSAFEVAEVQRELGACHILLDQEVTSVSSGKTIHRLVVTRDNA
jgi:2-polyprenyl-3-methyl-5-hydroxy-6-metoxy-1,4-benzoquinol methylase